MEQNERRAGVRMRQVRALPTLSTERMTIDADKQTASVSSRSTFLAEPMFAAVQVCGLSYYGAIQLHQKACGCAQTAQRGRGQAGAVAPAPTRKLTTSQPRGFSTGILSPPRACGQAVMLGPPRSALGPCHLRCPPEVPAEPRPLVCEVRGGAGLHEQELCEGTDDLVSLAGVVE